MAAYFDNNATTPLDPRVRDAMGRPQASAALLRMGIAEAEALAPRN